MAEKTEKKKPKKGNPQNLRPAWKKGQSGNPNGGKLHNPEIKKLKNLTEAELIEVGNLIIQGTYEDLVMRAKAPNATVLTMMSCAIAQKAIKGDTNAYNAVLDRFVGKVKERSEVNATVTGKATVMVTMPSNGREAK